MMTSKVEQAAKLGTEAGQAAASWVFDGNTPQATYAWALKGIRDGDPEVMDSYAEPTLSGEWADGYTLDDLAADLDVDAATDEEAAAWEQAASEAFWHELERAAAYQVEGEV